MQNIKESSIDIVLSLLKHFLKGKSIIKLSQKYRENLKIFHYYNEIIRYWSKLNYIVRKTLRSFNRFEIPDKNEMAKYLFSTYRILWEKASNKSILTTLNLSKNQNSNFYRFLDKLRTFSWEKALSGKSKKEKLSLEEAIPNFVIERLLPVMSFNFISENIQFMNNINKKTDCTVRINDLSSTTTNIDLVEIIQHDLNKNGIIFRQDLDFPELFHIPIEKKSLILKSKWYLQGNLIFQDKGSVAVVQVLSPHPNELICDMCAAPGIKTSLIAQFSKNRARIIAGEFFNDRLLQTKKILNNLNVLNAFLINSDSIKFPIRFENQFDRVLLDAPCTGSGTFLENPELKWRQNESFFHQNITLQKKLLEKALNLLKPGGVLVYSTCSLYSEEGELQILKFLNHLEPIDLPKWFSPSYKINNLEIPGTGRLFPSIHHTQGFFIGKFKKKKR